MGIHDIPAGFRPGLVKLGADGDLVTNANKAHALVMGYIRKGGLVKEAEPESKMATHVNQMKAKGALRTQAKSTIRAAGGAQSIRTGTRRSTSPGDVSPGDEKKRRAGDIERTKWEGYRAR